MPGLGRGLTALLSDSNIKKAHTDKEDDKNAAGVGSALSGRARSGKKNISGMVVKIGIDDLKASVYQPRKNFNEENLHELADSIRQHGLLEPLLVKNSKEGGYEVICGERRLRACRIAGVKEIPCLIRDELEQQNAYAVALVENIQREDLNPLELAEALSQMISECGLSQEELARNVGKSRSTVTNILRINKLPPKLKAMIAEGALDLGHAKVLMGLDSEFQERAAALAVQRGLNVRQTEALVKSIKAHGEAAFGRKTAAKPEDFSRLEEFINFKFPGIRCLFTVKNQDKGKITFSYNSKAQLERILRVLGINLTSVHSDAALSAASSTTAPVHASVQVSVPAPASAATADVATTAVTSSVAASAADAVVPKTETPGTTVVENAATTGAAAAAVEAVAVADTAADTTADAATDAVAVESTVAAVTEVLENTPEPDAETEAVTGSAAAEAAAPAEN